MSQGAIVITGASSGIGRACALRLDGAGYRVFAGVRREVDGEALRGEASERLTPLRLDVTQQEDAAAAAETVASSEGGLAGLVNNAGVSFALPLELVPEAAARQLFEVNVLGLLAVSRALLPLLRQGRGRIVNIGSASGLLAMPGVSHYAASKFAVQAVSEALRVELHPQGIRVSTVLPGAVETAIWEKSTAAQKKMRAAVSPEAVAPYEPLLALLDQVGKNASGIPADAVARVVERALSAQRPKPRYLVGREASQMAWLARLPVRLRDWMILKMLQKGF